MPLVVAVQFGQHRHRVRAQHTVVDERREHTVITHREARGVAPLYSFLECTERRCGTIERFHRKLAHVQGSHNRYIQVAAHGGVEHVAVENHRRVQHLRNALSVVCHRAVHYIVVVVQRLLICVAKGHVDALDGVVGGHYQTGARTGYLKQHGCVGNHRARIHVCERVPAHLYVRTQVVDNLLRINARERVAVDEIKRSRQFQHVDMVAAREEVRTEGIQLTEVNRLELEAIQRAVAQTTYARFYYDVLRHLIITQVCGDVFAPRSDVTTIVAVVQGGARTAEDQAVAAKRYRHIATLPAYVASGPIGNCTGDKYREDAVNTFRLNPQGIYKGAGLFDLLQDIEVTVALRKEQRVVHYRSMLIHRIQCLRKRAWVEISDVKQLEVSALSQPEMHVMDVLHVC